MNIVKYNESYFKCIPSYLLANSISRFNFYFKFKLNAKFNLNAKLNLSAKLKELVIKTHLLFLILIVTSCSKTNRDFNAIFADGLDSITGISLFNLLDAYPALKNAMKKLQPEEFNLRLNDSLVKRRQNVPTSLRALQSILNNNDSGLREGLRKISLLLNKIRTNDVEAYKRSLPFVDKLRRNPGQLIPALIPIRNEGLVAIFETKTQSEIDKSIDSIVSTLSKAKNQETMRDLEDFFYKLLGKNQNAKQSLAVLLEGFFSGEDIRNGDFRDRLVETLGGIGESFSKKAGTGNGFKKSGTVLKELVLNIRNNFITGGSNFDSNPIYATSGFSSEFSVYWEDFYIAFRRLIRTPNNLLANPSESLLAGLARNYQSLKFTETMNGLDSSLARMIEVDLRGRNRISSFSADSISALEHLFFTLSVADKFGYFWDNDPENPRILSESGGRITVGDALHSLSSKLSTAGTFVRQGNLTNGSSTIPLTGSNTSTSSISNGFLVLGAGIPTGATVTSKTGSSVTLSQAVTQTRTNSVITFQTNDSSGSGAGSIANLGISAIIWNSSISDFIKKNGAVFTYNLNTSALSLLEGESKGLNTGAGDLVYNKTVPWALGIISSTLFSGKAPYYNADRKDSSGNILTADGKIYRSSDGIDQIYKSTWSTSSYSIPSININNSANNRWVGLGGYSGSVSSYTGRSYTISEIEISDSDRALRSDEEAFFKNFQWLLYQKRMVIVIPISIDALGGTLREAAYITLIGNGLSGLMKVKPFCQVTSCSENDNGKWLISGANIKTNFKVAETDLQNFSSQPGDSVFLLEVWGYGIAANASTQLGFTDNTVFQQVYNLLFQKAGAPSSFYGPIPPLIRWNFQALERLGFLTSETVTPANVNDYWSSRNKLLPLIASLAKTFVDQADSSNGIDPFLILSRIADVLARPYLLLGSDPTNSFDTNDSAVINSSLSNIHLFRIRGYSGSFGIRSPSMPIDTLYFPEATLRSPFSFLIENTQRSNDGILNLLGKGNTLDGLGNFLFGIGKLENKQAVNKFNQGLQLLFTEIRLNSEVTNLNQFNISTSLLDLRSSIVDEVTNNGTNLNLSTWDKYDDVADFLGDFLSLSSVYSYIPNLKEVVKSIAYSRPSFGELDSFLDLVASLFVDSNKNQTYFITELVSKDLVAILPNLKGNTRELVGLLDGLTKPNGFLSYFYLRAVSDYSADDVIRELEVFLVSTDIQDKSKGKQDLFYNIGEVLGLLARLTETTRAPGGMPHWFPDHWNSTEDYSSAFDRLNFILSKK